MPPSDDEEDPLLCTPGALFRGGERLLDRELGVVRSSVAHLCQSRLDAAEQQQREFADEVARGTRRFDAYCRRATDEARQYIREQEEGVEATEGALLRAREAQLQTTVHAVLQSICHAQAEFVADDARNDDALKAATYNAFVALLRDGGRN